MFFTIVSTLLVILFLYGYKRVKSGIISDLTIIKWSVAFSILMTLSIPGNSSDIYGYSARGGQQTLYKQNPYIQTVSEIKDHKSNPLFLNFDWKDQPTTYGPIFILTTKVILNLSNNNLFLSLLNFKLLNLTVFLFLILFVLKMNRLNDLYLLAWNPLILIQGLWNCHNDLISGLFIFLGIYLFKKERYFWSIFALTMSGSIKYVSLIIIPLIVFYLIKNRVRKRIFLNCILGFCCGCLLIVIVSIDYLHFYNKVDSENLQKIISNIALVHKSLIATVFILSKYLVRWKGINCDLNFLLRIIKYCVYFIFAIIYLFISVKKKSNLFYDLILVLFLFFSFTLAKFHSWYLLNVLLLIPFLESCILKQILLSLSMSHTYAITFLDQAKILNFTTMTLLPILYVLLRSSRKK